jgi:hypothetical protein
MVRRDCQIQRRCCKVCAARRLLVEERRSEGWDADRALHLNGLSSLLPAPYEGFLIKFLPYRSSRRERQVIAPSPPLCAVQWSDCSQPAWIGAAPFRRPPPDHRGAGVTTTKPGSRGPRAPGQWRRPVDQMQGPGPPGASEDQDNSERLAATAAERGSAAPKTSAERATASTAPPAGTSSNPTLCTWRDSGIPQPPAAGAAAGDGGISRIAAA